MYTSRIPKCGVSYPFTGHLLSLNLNKYTYTYIYIRFVLYIYKKIYIYIYLNEFICVLLLLAGLSSKRQPALRWLNMLLKKTALSNVEAPFWRNIKDSSQRFGQPSSFTDVCTWFCFRESTSKKNRQMRFKYLLSFGVSWMFVVFAGRLFSTFPKYNVSKAKFQHL